MKKFYISLTIILATFMFLPLSCYGQNMNQPMNYLFNKGKLGIFAGPYFRQTKIDGYWTDISGGGGGLYYNRRFFIAGNSFGQWVPGASESLSGSVLSVSSNGATIGVNFFPEKIIHINTGMYIGGANAKQLDKLSKVEIATMDMTFLMPMADIEVNLYEAFRFFLGCDYRFAHAKKCIPGIQSHDFEGFSIYWGIKTGLF